MLAGLEAEVFEESQTASSSPNGTEGKDAAAVLAQRVEARRWRVLARVLRVLALYQRWTPEALEGAHFPTSRVLVQVGVLLAISPEVSSL